MFTPGAYIPQFKKYAHMINMDPTFKDYSWVKRPADRIAHTLNYLMPMSKEASAQPDARAIRGDELAVMYGVVDNPWKAHLEKIAEFDLMRHENPAKQAVATTVLPKAFHGEFDNELLSKMARHAFPGRVMHSLISRSMVMPLASFNSFVTGKCLHDSQADSTVKEARDKMAGIRAILIRRISSEPDFSQLFSSACNQFSPMSEDCGDVVDQFMDNARDQFSLRYEALAKRACANPLHLKSASTISATISDAAFGLGALYNAYLAKTASCLEDDWMLTAQMAYLR
jgi:hypothetical protein